MSSFRTGEHSHVNHPNLEKHLEECADGVNHSYAESYVHKHIEACLEDDPSAVYHEKVDSVLTFKIIMIVLFLVICVIGIIPKAWPAFSRNEKALSFLNCFSAGLFLAMAICHMLPHAVGLYSVWVAKNEIDNAFPLPYVMFFTGFLLVLGIDRVLAKLLGFEHSHDEEKIKEVMANMEAQSKVSKTSKQAVSPDQSDQEKEGGQVDGFKTPGPINETDIELKKGESAIPANEEKTAAATVEKEGEEVHEHEQEHVHAVVSKRTAVMLVLALGFHALFEGVAFGLMTEVGSAGQLAVGVVVHKGAEALSLGGALARSGFSLCAVSALIFLFAILTPIGGIAGLIFANMSMIVDSVFMAIAAGTFIYVSCCEMIVHEFDKGQYQWLKFLLIILGGAVIVGLHFLPHGHSHDGENGHTHGPGGHTHL